MNYPRNTALVLVLAVAASAASAQQGGLTRAQVQAELAEATRNGDMMAPGELGLTQRQPAPRSLSLCASGRQDARRGSGRTRLRHPQR